MSYGGCSIPPELAQQSRFPWSSPTQKGGGAVVPCWYLIGTLSSRQMADRDWNMLEEVLKEHDVMFTSWTSRYRLVWCYDIHSSPHPVIEPVPVGTPVTYCHRMVICAKKNGTPRCTIDMQALNTNATRETHHTPSPFHFARSVLHNTSQDSLWCLEWIS